MPTRELMRDGAGRRRERGKGRNSVIAWTDEAKAAHRGDAQARAVLRARLGQQEAACRSREAGARARAPMSTARSSQRSRRVTRRGAEHPSKEALVLLAAARLRIGGRRLRALATGDAARGPRVRHQPTRRCGWPRRGVMRAPTRQCSSSSLRARGHRLRSARISGRTCATAGRRRRFCACAATLPAGGIAIVGARDAGGAACRFAFDLARRWGVRS